MALIKSVYTLISSGKINHKLNCSDVDYVFTIIK